MKKNLLLKAIAIICFSSYVIKLQAQCPIVPFAVVELFTSQGCAYCPAAGNSLDSVIAAEKISGRNVICIAEHVQYGSAWQDTYKDAQFSPRQTVYCQYVGVPKGTPECFVNGKLIAAPDPRMYTINPLINNQLGAGNVASAGVCLTLQSGINDPTLTVAYTLSGNTSGANLIVALIEDGTVVNVTAGENQGKTIHESGVSRNFVVTPITSTTGTVVITPPANCVRLKSRIVGYVQNPTSMFIRGGTTGIDLATASTTGLLEEEQNLGLSIFPNPATNNLSVNYSNVNAKEAITIRLVDISGRVVYSERINNKGNAGKYSQNIDVSSMAKGLYILTCESDNELINKKIIIK